MTCSWSADFWTARASFSGRSAPPAWRRSCRTRRFLRSTASGRSGRLKRQVIASMPSPSPRARRARTSRPTQVPCTFSVSTVSAAATWSWRSAAAWWVTLRALPRRHTSAAWALPRSRRRCLRRWIRPSAARRPSTCLRGKIRRAAFISPVSSSVTPTRSKRCPRSSTAAAAPRSSSIRCSAMRRSLKNSTKRPCVSSTSTSSRSACR